MQPINQTSAGTAQLESQARSQGQQLQNQWNQQVGQRTSDYSQAQNQANQAYGNLSSFGQNIPQNTQAYTKQMSSAYGYNPQVTSQMESQYLPTLQNATRLNEAMSSLPQAVQQEGNYSGATAGQIAQNYANQANAIGQQTAGVNTMLGGLGSGINAQAGLAGVVGSAVNNMLTNQQNAYANAYSNAVQQMGTAATALNNIENVAQQQGTATANQISAYQNARNQYINAQAAAENASANMIKAQQVQQQMNMINAAQSQFQKIYGPQYQVAMAELAQGQPVTVKPVSQTTNNVGIPVGVSTGSTIPLRTNNQGGGLTVGQFNPQGGSPYLQGGSL